MSGDTDLSTLLPDPTRTREVRDDVLRRLHVSLRYLVAEAAPLPPEIERDCLDRLAGLAAAGPDPALFGLNALLRRAARTDDRAAYEQHRRRFARWRLEPSPAHRWSTAPIRVQALDGRNVDPVRLDIIRHLFSDDQGLTTRLQAPSTDLLERASDLLSHTLRTMAVATPAWSGEFAALVTHILTAVNPEAPGGGSFVGGSVFDLFGAVLVNPANQRDLATCLLTLVHESSHLRLFCHHLDDPVVLNAGDTRFPSPLRRRPRPMEGIFHTTWVSARMARFGADLLTGPAAAGLDPHLRRGVEQGTRDALTAFHDGDRVLLEHGRLTDLGHRLADDARGQSALVQRQLDR